MLVEVIGKRALPDDIDRDDVEELLAEALGPDGAVTGAGTWPGGWHLDVEVDDDAGPFPPVLTRLAAALVGHDLGWVELRPEQADDARPADELI